MLSPQLRKKIHTLWSLFWSAGMTNPLVAIEQITYLLFIRQLESLDRERVKRGKASIYSSPPPRVHGAKHLGNQPINQGPLKFANLVEDHSQCRWSFIRQNVSFELLNNTVFPWLRGLEKWLAEQEEAETRKAKAANAKSKSKAEADETASDETTDRLRQVTGRLDDAYFALDPNKTETLGRAIGLIDDLFRALDTRSVNSDIMGDIFEHLLDEIQSSGKNGQFRTPRHITRFMVDLLQPELGKTVLDPACGTGGFLINTLMHWRARYTDADVLKLEWDGTPHNLHPAWPKGKTPNFSKLIHGFDNDRTMVRIAWMNLILHDLEFPSVERLDSLSKRMPDKASGTYDYILANPPFTGETDKGDLSTNRRRVPAGKGGKPLTTASELLFVWLMLDLLKIGGRAAVIVPDGVLFGNTLAHRALRRQLLFENTLEGVISLPANMFQPYSGVKTSILLFQKAETGNDDDKTKPGDAPRTRDVWFYEIESEGFSLDQKRKARYGQDNDLWDALEKFKAWKSCLNDPNDCQLKAAAVSTSYHQPNYWEERWRTVDDDLLKIFPQKAGDKGHTFAIHELWPKLNRTPKNSVDTVVSSQRSQLTTVLSRMVANAVHRLPAEDREAVAEKAFRQAAARAMAISKDEALLDREFDQFAATELKAVIDEVKATAIRDALEAITTKAAIPIARPSPQSFDQTLRDVIVEFAKLDGYNVWRRSNDVHELFGKERPGTDGKPERTATALSWIVPVRAWAQRESWGADPKTNKEIAKSTHDKQGNVRAEYTEWLRDKLEVFNADATVKDEHRDRLEPDCIEALDFNLSAGRHKPFIFDVGQHRPPAELIKELDDIHRQIRERLSKLLKLVNGEEPVAEQARRIFRKKGAGKLPTTFE